MPWEKAFDVDQALEQAMGVFWANGYEATSTQNLLTQMGINRGSLYATFGSKHALFIKALRHYLAEYQTRTLARLQRDLAPRDAVFELFRQVVDATLADKSQRGCFLVNTVLDQAPHDAEVQKLVSSALDQVELFFSTQIVAGQKTGGIAQSVDPQDAASSLLGLMLGVRVLSRAKPNKKRLEAILAQAEIILG